MNCVMDMWTPSWDSERNPSPLFSQPAQEPVGLIKLLKKQLLQQRPQVRISEDGVPNFLFAPDGVT